MRAALRTGCAALLVLLACSSLRAVDEEAAPTPSPPPPAVPEPIHLSWEQGWSTLQVTLRVDTTQYAHINHEAVSGTHSSYVRLVFSNDDGSFRFVRMHLAGAVKPEETSVEVFTDGVRLTLSKAVAADWDEGVLMWTEKPLRATYKFPLADGSVYPIQVAEYLDIDAAVRMALEARPEAAATSEQVAEVALALQQAVSGAMPQCILEHFCVCSGGRVFDGVECADGAAWVKETQLSAPAGLPAAGGRVSLPHELVSMPVHEVVALSNAQQAADKEYQLWPRHLYAETLKGKRLLVFGASLVHLEALLFVRLAAHVTVLDSSELNLEAFQMLVDATDLDSAYLDMSHYTGRAMLDTLSREYDAVVVLDSFTRGPTELAVEEYRALASRLKIGGRWLQLAPSRARYVAHGKPPLAAGSHGGHPFGSAQGLASPRELSYAPTEWYDWMSSLKLKILLKPLEFEVALEGPAGDGHWTWIDLVRTK